MNGLPIRCTVPAVVANARGLFMATAPAPLGYIPEIEDTILLYGGLHEALRVEVRPVYRDGSRGDWTPLDLPRANPNGYRYDLMVGLAVAGVDAVLPTHGASALRVLVSHNSITDKWEITSQLPGFSPCVLPLSQDCGLMLYAEAALGSGVCFPVHSGGIIE